MEGKDSGIFSPGQNNNEHPPNYHSFDEEEDRRSLSDSSSNTSYDSGEVVGNWKRRKRMDGNEVKPKKVSFSPSSVITSDDALNEKGNKERVSFSPSSVTTSDKALNEKGNEERVRKPTTSTGLVLHKNPHYDAGSSSSVMHYTEKKKGNYRTDGDPKVYKIKFPDFIKLQGIQICESYGNESVLDMVTRKFQKVSFKSYKPKLEKMLFLDENKICFNVGRPAGELSTDKTYICSFKKTCALDLSNCRREYALPENNVTGELRNFFVTLLGKSCRVSPFAKLCNKIQVDFFRGATIFEALVRDKRFNERILRYCRFTCEGAALTELSVKADNFQDKCIEIRLAKEEDKDLPKFVPPRKRPDQDPAVINGEVKDEPRKSTQDLHPATCTAGPSTETPLISSTPSIRDKSTENLTHLIECAFEIKSKKLTPTAKQELVQRCNKIFRNFASAENTSMFVSQSEDLNEIAKSVGAVFMVKDAGSPFLVGTCFRIGVQYVITNKHVCDILSEGPPEMIFIDFAFKKGEVPNPFGRRYVPENLLVSSSSCGELDYAILQLREPPQELPPCIFTAGVTIMDPAKNPHSMLHGQNLRLIGHPRGQPKKIDPICPVSTIPQDGAAYYSYATRREITDQRRETYHVSDFYRGSSGSPGILFQNDKKYLAVLHTKGFSLEDPNRSTIEQGVLFTEIVKHVLESIENAHQDSSSENILKYKTLADIFPSIESWPELMDIDEYM